MMPHKFAATIINNQILLLKLCQKKKKKQIAHSLSFAKHAPKSKEQRTDQCSNAFLLV